MDGYDVNGAEDVVEHGQGEDENADGDVATAVLGALERAVRRPCPRVGDELCTEHHVSKRVHEPRDVGGVE